MHGSLYNIPSVTTNPARAESTVRQIARAVGCRLRTAAAVADPIDKRPQASVSLTLQGATTSIKQMENMPISTKSE